MPYNPADSHQNYSINKKHTLLYIKTLDLKNNDNYDDDFQTVMDFYLET